MTTTNYPCFLDVTWNSENVDTGLMRYRIPNQPATDAVVTALNAMFAAIGANVAADNPSLGAVGRCTLTIDVTAGLSGPAIGTANPGAIAESKWQVYMQDNSTPRVKEKFSIPCLDPDPTLTSDLANQVADLRETRWAAAIAAMTNSLIKPLVSRTGEDGQIQQAIRINAPRKRARAGSTR